MNHIMMPHHSTLCYLCYFHHCTTVITALLHNLHPYNTCHHSYTTAYTIPHYITMPLALLALHVTSHYICTTLHYITCIVAPLCITPCYIMEHCTSWSISHHAPLSITPCYITLHLSTLHCITCIIAPLCITPYAHAITAPHYAPAIPHITIILHVIHHITLTIASHASLHSHTTILPASLLLHQHASEVCYLHHYTNNTTCCISLHIISRHQSPQHAPH